MPEPNWSELTAPTQTPSPILQAVTFLHEWMSFSQPVSVSVEDGSVYVVKGTSQVTPQALCTEQVAGRLAALLGAPVPPVALIDITELRKLEPRLTGFVVDLAHGSLLIPEPVGEREGLISGGYCFKTPNRARFAALSVLYSWFGCFIDHQVLFEDADPNLVHSVDHGHFLPDGPVWAAASLDEAADAEDDPEFSGVLLTAAELAAPRAQLAATTAEDIGSAIAQVPGAWGVDPVARAGLGRYLFERRIKLLQTWGLL